MRNRIITSTVIAVVAILVLTWIYYRLPVGSAVEGSGVAYIPKNNRTLDSGFRAVFFEALWGNKRLYMGDQEVIWVSEEDYKKVWGAHPMRGFRYRVSPVLAGLGRAKIIDVNDVDDQRRAVFRQREEELRRAAEAQKKQMPQNQKPSGPAPLFVMPDFQAPSTSR